MRVDNRAELAVDSVKLREPETAPNLLEEQLLQIDKIYSSLQEVAIPTYRISDILPNHLLARPLHEIVPLREQLIEEVMVEVENNVNTIVIAFENKQFEKFYEAYLQVLQLAKRYEALVGGPPALHDIKKRLLLSKANIASEGALKDALESAREKANEKILLHNNLVATADKQNVFSRIFSGDKLEKAFKKNRADMDYFSGEYDRLRELKNVIDSMESQPRGLLVKQFQQCLSILHFDNLATYRVEAMQLTEALSFPLWQLGLSMYAEQSESLVSKQKAKRPELKTEVDESLYGKLLRAVLEKKFSNDSRYIQAGAYRNDPRALQLMDIVLKSKRPLTKEELESSEIYQEIAKAEEGLNSADPSTQKRAKARVNNFFAVFTTPKLFESTRDYALIADNYINQIAGDLEMRKLVQHFRDADGVLRTTAREKSFNSTSNYTLNDVVARTIGTYSRSGLQDGGSLGLRGLEDLYYAESFGIIYEHLTQTKAGNLDEICRASGRLALEKYAKKQLVDKSELIALPAQSREDFIVMILAYLSSFNGMIRNDDGEFLLKFIRLSGSSVPEGVEELVAGVLRRDASSNGYDTKVILRLLIDHFIEVLESSSFVPEPHHINLLADLIELVDDASLVTRLCHTMKLRLGDNIDLLQEMWNVYTHHDRREGMVLFASMVIEGNISEKWNHLRKTINEQLYKVSLSQRYQPLKFQDLMYKQLEHLGISGFEARRMAYLYSYASYDAEISELLLVKKLIGSNTALQVMIEYLQGGLALITNISEHMVNELEKLAQNPALKQTCMHRLHNIEMYYPGYRPRLANHEYPADPIFPFIMDEYLQPSFVKFILVEHEEANALAFQTEASEKLAEYLLKRDVRKEFELNTTQFGNIRKFFRIAYQEYQNLAEKNVYEAQEALSTVCNGRVIQLAISKPDVFAELIKGNLLNNLMRDPAVLKMYLANIEKLSTSVASVKFIQVLYGEHGSRAASLLKGYIECINEEVISAEESGLILDFAREFRIITPKIIKRYKEEVAHGRRDIFIAGLNQFADRLISSKPLTTEQRSTEYYPELIQAIYPNNAGDWTNFENNESCVDRTASLEKYKYPEKYVIRTSSAVNIIVKEGEVISKETISSIREDIDLVNKEFANVGYNKEKMIERMSAMIDDVISKIDPAAFPFDINNLTEPSDKLILIISLSQYGKVQIDERLIKQLIMMYQFTSFDDIQAYFSGTSERVMNASNMDYALLCELNELYADRLKETLNKLISEGVKANTLREQLQKYYTETVGVSIKQSIAKLQVSKWGMSPGFVAQLKKQLKKERGKEYDDALIIRLVKRYTQVKNKRAVVNAETSRLVKAISGQIDAQYLGTMKAINALGFQVADLDSVWDVALEELANEKVEAVNTEGFDDQSFGAFWAKQTQSIFMDDLGLIKKELSKFTTESGSLDGVSELEAFLSMTTPSAHARGTGGVCVSGDNPRKHGEKVMWNQNNFFQFVYRDPVIKQCIGLSMCHEVEENGEKILTVSMNPSSTYLYKTNETALFESLLEQIIDFAKENGFDHVAFSSDVNIRTNRTGGIFEKAMNHSITKHNRRIDLSEPVTFSEHPSYTLTSLDVVWSKNVGI